MGTNFKNSFNNDCFKDLKCDLGRLVKNFKKNYFKCKKVPCRSIKNSNLKWWIVGGILGLLIISQIGIPIAFLCTIIILITILCDKW